MLFLSTNGQSPEVAHLSAQKFHEKLGSSTGTLLDVRTQNEFANGHLEQAGQLNFYALDFKKKLLLLPKNQEIYLYCNTGYRSEIAAEYLIKNGYKKVYNLVGGTLAWNQNEYPVIVEADARPDTQDLYLPDDYDVLIHTKSLVLVDFYAPWCAPCRKMMPMIDSLKTSYHNEVNIVKVNIDASKKLVKKMQIIGVPYLVLYQNGTPVFSHNGLITRKEIEELLSGITQSPTL